MRRQIHQRIYNKFRRKNCDRRGEQKSNLTKEELEGLDNLTKRINKRELLVLKTDKSSRFAITTEEEYLKMGEAHIKNDKKITRDELIETELNGSSMS